MFDLLKESSPDAQAAIDAMRETPADTNAINETVEGTDITGGEEMLGGSMYIWSTSEMYKKAEEARAQGKEYTATTWEQKAKAQEAYDKKHK